MTSLARSSRFVRRPEEELAAALLPHRLIVLAGPTGSGKTALLRQRILEGAQALDLEALAGHRGSAFGALKGKAQPTQEEFTLRIVRYLRAARRDAPVLVEEKGEYLGRLAIPKTLRQRMNSSGVEMLHCPLEVRVDRLARSYGTLSVKMLTGALETLRGRLAGDEIERALDFISQHDLKGAIRVVLAYYDRAYAEPAARRVIASVDLAAAPQP